MSNVVKFLHIQWNKFITKSYIQDSNKLQLTHEVVYSQVFLKIYVVLLKHMLGFASLSV